MNSMLICVYHEDGFKKDSGALLGTPIVAAPRENLMKSLSITAY